MYERLNGEKSVSRKSGCDEDEYGSTSVSRSLLAVAPVLTAFRSPLPALLGHTEGLSPLY